MRFLNLAWQRFGRWTVLPRYERVRLNTLWLCRCDCGAEGWISTGNLRSEKSVSCGCFAKSQRSERARTHGMSKTNVYNTWQGMKGRCLNPDDDAFKNYGGRGIEICARWLDFENFWTDMGPAWRPGLTIERQNNDGNYEPGNCIWIPLPDQSKNRRGVRKIETQWGSLTLREAAIKAGMPVHTVTARFFRGVPQEHLFDPIRSAQESARMGSNARWNKQSPGADT